MSEDIEQEVLVEEVKKSRKKKSKEVDADLVEEVVTEIEEPKQEEDVKVVEVAQEDPKAPKPDLSFGYTMIKMIGLFQSKPRKARKYLKGIRSRH